MKITEFQTVWSAPVSLLSSHIHKAMNTTREIHLQTPNRRVKSNVDMSKNSNKIIRKNLNKVLSAASGEVSEVASPNVSISDDNLITESVEIIVDSLNPANTLFPSSVSTCDLTPSSTITSAGTKGFIDSSNPVNMPLPLAVSAAGSTPSSAMSISGTKVEGTDQTIDSATLKKISVESELEVKQVKESMAQVLNSWDVHSRNKKILDAVVNAVIEDHYGIGISDVGWFHQLKSKKGAVMLLNFLGVITAIWFLISGHQHATFGPAPT